MRCIDFVMDISGAVVGSEGNEHVEVTIGIAPETDPLVACGYVRAVTLHLHPSRPLRWDDPTLTEMVEQVFGWLVFRPMSVFEGCERRWSLQSSEGHRERWLCQIVLPESIDPQIASHPPKIEGNDRRNLDPLDRPIPAPDL